MPRRLEGCYDPTTYEALTNIEAEVRAKGCADFSILGARGKTNARGAIDLGCTLTRVPCNSGAFSPLPMPIRYCQVLCAKRISAGKIDFAQGRNLPLIADKRAVPAEPPDASYSCTSCCLTAYRLHGATGHRPASRQSGRPGNCPPHGCGGGSPGSAVQ